MQIPQSLGSSELDCVHCEHFILYNWPEFLLLQHEMFSLCPFTMCLAVWLWLFCEQTLISCRQHNRCSVSVLFSGWAQLLLTPHVLYPVHHLLEPLLDSAQYVNIILVLGSHIELVVHQDSWSFSARQFSGKAVPKLYHYMGLFPYRGKIWRLPLLNFQKFLLVHFQNLSEWQPCFPEYHLLLLSVVCNKLWVYLSTDTMAEHAKSLDKV